MAEKYRTDHLLRRETENTFEKQQFTAIISVILPMFLVCAQLHGVLLMVLIHQQKSLETAYTKQIAVEVNKAVRKLRVKRRRIRRKRHKWVNPGRTDPWWINLKKGVLGEEEWHLNLRMNRDHFMQLVERLRPFLQHDPCNFRSDALSVEKKVAVTLYYLKDQGSYRMT